MAEPTVVVLRKHNINGASISLYWPERPEAWWTVDLECAATDAPFAPGSAGNALAPDFVKQAGAKLFDNLLKQGAIATHVDQILNAQEPNPIYLYIDVDEADKLPWEMLCTPRGFMALDQRWQIGRMVGIPGRDGIKDTELSFFMPLRMMIFLTATAIDATPEWNALYGAIEASGLVVQLIVYVSQEELLEEIKKLAENLGNQPNQVITIDARPLPYNFKLDEAIKNQAVTPHIIHFFCHGSVVDGPHLELANSADDWDEGKSSERVNPDDFAELRRTRINLLMVTLNCCESAAPVGPGNFGAGAGVIDNTSKFDNSFIRSIVAGGYTPAAVGMREPVDVADANAFTRAFYTTLFNRIKAVVNNPGETPDLEWASCLYEVRTKLCRDHAGGRALQDAAALTKEWTLPVLYSKPTTYSLRLVPGGEKKIGELKQFEDARSKQAQLYARTGDPDIQAILDDLDIEINRLRAELFGGN